MEIIEIKGAKTFLRKISLENENHYGCMRNFMFRGQRDADWEILPTAFRKKSRLFNESGYLPEIGERSNRAQIYWNVLDRENFYNENIERKWKPSNKYNDFRTAFDIRFKNI